MLPLKVGNSPPSYTATVSILKPSFSVEKWNVSKFVNGKLVLFQFKPPSIVLYTAVMPSIYPIFSL